MIVHISSIGLLTLKLFRCSYHNMSAYLDAEV